MHVKLGLNPEVRLSSTVSLSRVLDKVSVSSIIQILYLSYTGANDLVTRYAMIKTQNVVEMTDSNCM